MRAVLLAAALLGYGSAASAADPADMPDADLFDAACLQSAPEFDTQSTSAPANTDAHVEAKAGRFCKIRVSGGSPVTQDQATGKAEEFAQRIGGKIVSHENQDGRRTFFFKIEADGDRFILSMKNEGPDQFFMIKRIGR